MTLWPLRQVLHKMQIHKSKGKIAGTNERKNKCIQIIDKIIKYLLTRQYEGESVHDYYIHFKNNTNALKFVVEELVTCFGEVMDFMWTYLYDK